MAYYRGDYYRGHGRGDYYRGRRAGDPFWGALLKGIGTVARGLLGIPTPATAAPSAATPPFALSGGLPAPSTWSFPIGPGANVPQPMVPRVNPGPRLPNPPRGTIAGPPLPAEFVAGAGHGRRRRRMNAGNVKALRRSIRRVCSFGKLVNSTKGALRKAANEVAPVHHARRALPPARR